MFQRFILAVVGLFFVTTAVMAQDPRGSLRGTVQDASGARVRSAKITVQAIESSMLRETLTEDRGEFRVDDVLAVPTASP